MLETDYVVHNPNVRLLPPGYRRKGSETMNDPGMVFLCFFFGLSVFAGLSLAVLYTDPELFGELGIARLTFIGGFSSGYGVRAWRR